jgi:hypothetical protein
MGPLQSYRARLPAQPGKRASDAEFLSDNVYSSDFDPMTEEEPKGLLDRLYKERFGAQPMRGGAPTPMNNSVPTTKRAY